MRTLSKYLNEECTCKDLTDSDSLCPRCLSVSAILEIKHEFEEIIDKEWEDLIRSGGDNSKIYVFKQMIKLKVNTPVVLDTPSEVVFTDSPDTPVEIKQSLPSSDREVIESLGEIENLLEQLEGPNGENKPTEELIEVKSTKKTYKKLEEFRTK